MRRGRTKRVVLGLLAVLLLAVGIGAVVALPRLPAIRFLASLREGPLPDGTRIEEFRLLEDPDRFGVRRLWVARADEGEDRPTVVVVHGADEKGLEDGRLLRLAVAFVQAGFTAIVPEVRGLVTMEPGDEDVTRLTKLLAAVSEGAVAGVDTRRVGVFAISVGGGLALSAAAEHVRAGRPLRAMCLVGAPDDVRRVARAWFATPLAPPGADGEAAERSSAAAFARSMVVRCGLARLVPEADRKVLREWLLASWTPKASPEGLSTPEGRALAETVLRGGSIEVAEADRLVDAAWDSLRPLSPAHSGDAIEGLRGVPVWLVHGAGDPLVSPSELAALAARLEGRGEVHSLVSRVVSHTGVGGEGTWETIRMVDGFFDQVDA